MNPIKSIWIVRLFIVGKFVLMATTKGDAKTFAYLVGDGSMASLDTDTNIRAGNGDRLLYNLPPPKAG